MEISDSPAYQSYLRARTALADNIFAGDAGVRALDAWREINAATWRLLRQNTEAWCYTAHELLRCKVPLQVLSVLARQIHPTAQRIDAWQERVLDLVGGAQAELAAIAESTIPTARYATAPIAD